MIPDVVNLAEKLGKFSDHWHPRIVGELNGQQVKLAKIHGAFSWHHHANEDELFLVLDGEFRMLLRDADGGTIEKPVRTGEFVVIPRGVAHCPVAERECAILLFEPAATLHTGNIVEARTRETLERI